MTSDRPDHLLHLDYIDAEGYASWSLTCEHDHGGRWRVVLQDGSPDPNFDESECWLDSWWSAVGSEILDRIDGPITVLPIPVEPKEWDYDNGGTIGRYEGGSS
jgi:hypothetical protein